MTINKNRVDIIANPVFTDTYLLENFFVEYPEDINLENLPESVVTIPFILNMITTVWYSEKKYTIDCMDEDLHHSLIDIKETFRLFYPSHSWSGELVPTQLIKNTLLETDNHDALGVLFTGGLDATYTSVAHADTRQLLITLTTNPKTLAGNGINT